MNKLKYNSISDDYVIGEKIGEGGFGDVYLGMGVKTKEKVAIKKIHITKGDTHKLMSEINYLKQLSLFPNCDRNILCYYDVYVNNDNAFLVTEYINGDNLRNTFRKLSVKDTINNNLLYIFLLSMLEHLLKSISIVHEHGIVHADIKPSNIMVRKNKIANDTQYGFSFSETYEPVLIDFGLSCNLKVRESCHKFAGTPIYMAPEVARDEIILPQSDLWSLGMTIYNILYGDPWKSYTEEQIIKSLSTRPTNFKINTSNKVLNDITNQMLHYDYSKRGTARQLYNKIFII